VTNRFSQIQSRLFQFESGGSAGSVAALQDLAANRYTYEKQLSPQNARNTQKGVKAGKVLT